VHFDRAGEGYVISRIDLRAEAEVPGINEEAFQEQTRLPSGTAHFPKLWQASRSA
jgi:hypothetical protein